MDKVNVQKRMSFLEKFLDTVINNVELRSSPATKAFLEMKDEKEFKKKKEEI